MTTKATGSTKKKVLKDPKGGLTQAGREHFKETEGANLKPGVKGPADTPEKMKRKGSFLRRHFANPSPGPMEDEKGKPTRRALSAQAWGEPLPKTNDDVKKLAAKGKKLLDEFHQSQEGAGKADDGKPPAAKTPKTTKAGKAPAAKPAEAAKKPSTRKS